METHRETSSRPYYTCEICGASFLDKYNFSRHHKVCAGEEVIMCHLCSKMFHSRQSLSLHISLHHREEENLSVAYAECTWCGKRFHNKRNLMGHHNKVHLNLKAYQCDKCNKKFYHMPSLYRHKLKCGQEKKAGTGVYTCTVCEKVFKRKDHLAQHMPKHSDEENYSCCRCGKTFKYSLSCIRHEKNCLIF